MQIKSPQSIYIHLPYCKTKCPYCDFASFANFELDDINIYTKAICNEIKFRMNSSDHQIKTIFFGGGTPSIFSHQDIEQILNTLKIFVDFDPQIEITLEANPGTIDLEKLQAFAQASITRISLGIQSFDKKLLDKLGRGHSLEDSYAAIENIKSCDFQSWSCDLIYGLPSQTLNSWITSLKEVVKYSPPHISAYALSIEPGTGYGKFYGDSKHPDLPSEDLVVKMYLEAIEFFAKNNLHQYEISNWSYPGHEARHNLCYWQAQEYYAFGLSAHGYVNNIRYQNTRDLHQYIKIFGQEILNKTEKFSFDYSEKSDLISEEMQIEEKILLGLRLNQGLYLSEKLKDKIHYSKLEFYLREKFLKFENQIISLTPKGFLLSNKIIADLIN